MAITPEDMTKAIRDITAEWIAAGKVKDARAIGDGRCYEMVRAVVERLGLDFNEVDMGRHPQVSIHDIRDYERAGQDFLISLTALRRAGEKPPADIPSSEFAELIGGAQHQWLKLGRLYYDASAPEGARRFLDMPFFADQIEGLRQEIAQRASASPAP